jgi:adenylate cyclase
MARQYRWTANFSVAQNEGIIRLATGAVEIDPGYARAWALIGSVQAILRFRFGRQDIDSWTAVEKALALDPNLAEAHAGKAGNLRLEGRFDEAWEELETALRLDPECYEASNGAADLCFSQGRLADAIPYYEKAAALMEAEIGCTAMLVTCFTAQGDAEGAHRAARMTLARAEAVLALDRGNGMAMSYGVAALAVLGEAERTRDWIRRALLIDPGNQLMLYNFACALCTLRDLDGAFALLGPYLAQVTPADLDWTKVDPDMDILREDPRFQAMIAAAEARLAAEPTA